MPSHHLILCCPLLLLPSVFPSIRVFSNESALLIRWPKDWSFSLNISPSNEHSGLISFRMDWLDFLAVQGTLKSLLQHHSSKASILRHSAFFIVQLWHPYMTTGYTCIYKTIQNIFELKKNYTTLKGNNWLVIPEYLRPTSPSVFLVWMRPRLVKAFYQRPLHHKGMWWAWSWAGWCPDHHLSSALYSL